MAFVDRKLKKSNGRQRKQSLIKRAIFSKKKPKEFAKNATAIVKLGLLRKKLFSEGCLLWRKLAHKMQQEIGKIH